jgi:hypothetical protein
MATTAPTLHSAKLLAITVIPLLTRNVRAPRAGHVSSLIVVARFVGFSRYCVIGTASNRNLQRGDPSSNCVLFATGTEKYLE